jgi:transposase
MRQKSGPEKQPAEDAIRDIRRATRRHFSAEEKIRVVLEGLRGEESIAELCRREGIASSMYYGWSKEFLEAGKRRLAGDTVRAATSDEVKDLRREAQALKEVVADLTLENRLLKKRMARPVCKGFDRERRKISLLQRIRPRMVSPGQDGDTRAPVLIKRSASRAFCI